MINFFSVYIMTSVIISLPITKSRTRKIVRKIDVMMSEIKVVTDRGTEMTVGTVTDMEIDGTVIVETEIGETETEGIGKKGGKNLTLKNLLKRYS